MRMRVLGGVTVAVDGRPTPIGSPRPRLLLALLASRHGTVVSESVLVEAIWSEDPPASVRTALQTYVSALRDELEPGRARRSPGRFVTREGDGYALRAEPADLDVAQFAAHIDQARGQHAQDPRGATALLDQALGLWADPPFGEFSDQPWAVGAATRLRDVHASALESRFGLALEIGDEGEVLVQMEEATAIYPYSERLAGQRMLALYRRGEQQGALAQYVCTRERLNDDLGLDPGRELQLLERAILTQDPALRTRGYKPAVAPKAAAPRVRAAKALFGRDETVRQVTQLLDTERCVCIVGPGGVGKSSVASSVVARVAPTFGGRIYHVDLAELGSREVLRAVAAEIRVVEHPLVRLADSITDAIGSQPTLIVVETCEVAVEAAGSAVSTILAAPGAQVLLTSQTPLHVQLECVHRLGPLDPQAAVSLLRARSGGAEPRALHAIAEAVGRLPLGLELAAARLATLGPEELLRGLESGPDLLVGASDRPERQRSVQSAVMWSMALLRPEHRQALASLATFSAPFTIGAAAALAGNPRTITAFIGELVDRSLLERIGGSPTRFRLPDPVRVVVREVSDAVQVQGERSRLAEIALESAQAAIFGSDPLVDLDEIRGEVVPAVVCFGEMGDSRQLTLAGLLGNFFIEQDRVGEGREQLSGALDANLDAPPLVRLLAASQLGFLTWYQGDLIETGRVLNGIVDLLDHAPSQAFRDLVDGCRAFVDQRFADAAAGLCAAADALSGEPKQRMLTLHMAGNACWYAGDRSAAVTRYRTQRELALSVDDQFQLAQALRFEAMVTAQLGDLEPAWRWAERSLAMARVMADSVSLAQASAASAAVASIAGADADAAHHAVNAIEASRSHFDVFALRTAIPIVAHSSQGSGKPIVAARLLGWYLDLLDRTGQTASPAVPHLAGTADGLRELLGSIEFARAAAKGAADGLGGVISDAASVAQGQPAL